MNPVLKQAYEAEVDAAKRLYQTGQLDQSFRHLEVAHVLGQRFVQSHVETHWWMLKIGMKRRSAREVIGQAVRIVLGAAGSAVGAVPLGNTGGTNISMFKRLPVDERLQKMLDKRDLRY